MSDYFPVPLHRVLESINVARAVLNLVPLTAVPAGVPGDCDLCPVAVALNAEQVSPGDTLGYDGTVDFARWDMARDVQNAWFGEGNYEQYLRSPEHRHLRLTVPLPQVLGLFAREFDEEYFPELILIDD